MRLLRPASAVTLAYASVEETDYPVWSSATTYAAGARAIKGHRIWVSSQGANTNHDPETAGASWWTDAGPTNQRAFLDDSLATATTAAESLTVAVWAGRIDAVSLLAADAESATVTQIIGAEVVFARTVTLQTRAVRGWYDWFMQPFTARSEVVVRGLIPSADALLIVTLSRPGGSVSLGLLRAGLSVWLGDTMAGVKLGLINYSLITTDGFGDTSFTPRGFASRNSYRLVMDRALARSARKIFSEYRATPVVWIGDADDDDELLDYGIYNDFEIDLDAKDLAYCTLTIQGMRR